MKVSFVPLSLTVLIVFVMDGYLYMLDLPGLSNNSEWCLRELKSERVRENEGVGREKE